LTLISFIVDRVPFGKPKGIGVLPFGQNSTDRREFHADRGEGNGPVFAVKPAHLEKIPGMVDTRLKNRKLDIRARAVTGRSDPHV
jgi:hypothetical protein